jgi:hypothetical protein
LAASTVSGLKYSGTIGHISDTNGDTGSSNWLISVASAASVIDVFLLTGTEDVATAAADTDTGDTFSISFTLIYPTG